MIYRGFEVWKQPTGEWMWGDPGSNAQTVGPFETDEQAMNDIDRFKRAAKELADK